MTDVHFIRGGRFVCTAGPDAPCHQYPACDCEAWTTSLHDDHGVWGGTSVRQRMKIRQARAREAS